VKVAWVLGGNGLLGTALGRVLRSQGTAIFCPSERFSWSDRHRLSVQMASAVQAFALRSAAAAQWEIYWAAGTGTMGSAADSLTNETLALRWLLQGLEDSAHRMPAPGAVAFASSAGAIYAGASDEVITEETLPLPTTAYAEEKLRQEQLLQGFVAKAANRVALAARISTLYGAGQALGKRQGLLSHIARSIIRNQPIQIYVPFDTVRDYIDAGDAAARMVDAIRLHPLEPRFMVKIVASESPVSIAEIISIFKRVARKNPRIVTSGSKLSALYTRRVHFRSVAMPDGTLAPCRRLGVGIAQLLMAERAVYARGPVRDADHDASILGRGMVPTAVAEPRDG
jgi:UDP-glucose 4-epimerase